MKRYYPCCIAKHLGREACWMGCTESSDTLKKAKEYFQFLMDNDYDILISWVQVYDEGKNKPRNISLKNYTDIFGSIHYDGKSTINKRKYDLMHRRVDKKEQYERSYDS